MTEAFHSEATCSWSNTPAGSFTTPNPPSRPQSSNDPPPTPHPPPHFRFRFIRIRTPSNPYVSQAVKTIAAHGTSASKRSSCHQDMWPVRSRWPIASRANLIKHTHKIAPQTSMRKQPIASLGLRLLALFIALLGLAAHQIGGEASTGATMLTVRRRGGLAHGQAPDDELGWGRTVAAQVRNLRGEYGRRDGDLTPIAKTAASERNVKNRVRDHSLTSARNRGSRK